MSSIFVFILKLLFLLKKAAKMSIFFYKYHKNENLVLIITREKIRQFNNYS